MTTDFKASQVQTHKVIVTGSFAGGSANQLLVYNKNADSSGSPNQGQIDPAKFNTSGVGSDAFLFISGGISTRGVAGSYGVSVIGGDLHVSGNLTVGGTYPSGGGSQTFQQVYNTGLPLLGVNNSSGSVTITGSLTNISAFYPPLLSLKPGFGGPYGSNYSAIDVYGWTTTEIQSASLINIRGNGSNGGGGEITLRSGGDINGRIGWIAGSGELYGSNPNASIQYHPNASSLKIANESSTGKVSIVNTNTGGEGLFVVKNGQTFIDANTNNTAVSFFPDPVVLFGYNTYGTVYNSGSLEQSGSAVFYSGLSGSLTQLTDGTSYLRAGSNITITSQSNGAVTISSTGGGGGNEYWQSTTSNLIFATGTIGVYISGSLRALYLSASAGAEVTGTLDINGGLQVTGSVNVSNGAKVAAGGLQVAGTLSIGGIDGPVFVDDTLANGSSYGVVIRNQSANDFAAANLSWVQNSTYAGTIGGLNNTPPGTTYGLLGGVNITALKEKVINFRAYDSGTPANSYSFGKFSSTGLQVTGSINGSSTIIATTGFSGSLTKLTDGTSYLRAGTNVTIVTGANGAVTISSTGGGGGSSPEFWFSTVANEAYTTGSVYINAGANGNQNLIKFDVSGSAYQSANVNTAGPVVGSYIAVEDVAVAESDWVAYSGSITIAAATVLASGSGGSISVIAGRGGYISGSYPTFGSAGGELLLAAGDGGASHDTALTGGAAGQVSIFAGQGGNGYSDPGAGGNLGLYAGGGGTKTATNVSEISNGGDGGALEIYAGAGGDSQFGGNPGIGGNITISPGPGGKTDTNEDGIAGNVFIEGAYIPAVSASQIASTLTLGSGDTGYGNYYGFRAVSINDSAINILGSSTDTFFFASGSIGAKDTSDRGVAVFGGDAAVSGTMSLEGGFRTLPTIVTSLPYTASMVDYIIAVSASAGPGVALPSAAMIGRNYIVKDVSGSAGTDNISVSVGGGGLIDGSSSYTISINRGSATFVYFGNSIGWGVI